MRIFEFPSVAIRETRQQLYLYGKEVKQKTWQSVKSPMNTWELFDYSLRMKISPTIGEWKEQTKPSWPWAEDQFRERISGQPLNPGETYKTWPHFKHVGESFKAGGKFSHTYMERFWPKKAWDPDTRPVNGEHVGIRFKYGDLEDVTKLLYNDPETRQAFLPIWFPEDTGVVHGERVPCTLGYLFTIRNGFFHVTYYIRSCDFLRHFKDDIYMAGRFYHYFKTKLNHIDLLPGRLIMHIGSLHVFINEKELLKS